MNALEMEQMDICTLAAVKSPTSPVTRLVAQRVQYSTGLLLSSSCFPCNRTTLFSNDICCNIDNVNCLEVKLEERSFRFEHYEYENKQRISSVAFIRVGASFVIPMKAALSD